jgi:transposase
MDTILIILPLKRNTLLIDYSCIESADRRGFDGFFIFDTLKNLLHADRVYLRDDLMLQGWMFVNFLSLLYYYRVYMKLREAELLKKYSVKDLIIHLRRIYKLKIDNKWVTSEIPKTSRKILEKLNFNLHIT